MIKFKKMSTTAKVVSGVGVTAVAGVAVIPVINTFIPNEKSKVPTYKYQGTFYKNKEDAEAARNKFNAMSGLVKLMQGKGDNPQHIDYKPLMAEFVSFVSKLFVVKVFQMDAETSTINHFQYDGMSTVQKQELMQKQIEGEIKYGDLQDMTSLVKYATAQKAGNTWMFTPVDQMMLSILGDGSGQGYSQGELKYAEISQTITKLKDNYNNYYKKLITDNFNGIAYSLVTGVTHHNDDELAEADHEKDATVNEGDGSGDEYTADLIRQFKQWGTLKTAFEDSKKKLDDYVSANTLTSDAMKAAFVQMVADNAVVGWNNIERYSSEEIELRDLLIKASAEQNSLDMASVPGGSTDANVIQGWNWAPSGDQSDNVYKDWQLELARDMQDRAKLLALHWTAAPAGAVKGLNAKPTGDGTGNEYLQQAFDLKQDFSDTDKAIGDLSAAIDAAVTAGTKPAPKDGVALTAKEAADRGISLALVGKHVDPVGLKDDTDYSPSFKMHEDFLKLQQAITDAQKAKADFDDQLANTMLDLTPGQTDKDGKPDMTGFTLESEIISNILKASSQVGDNFKQNYNQDQVDMTQAKQFAQDLQEQIATMAAQGLKAAPDGAKLDNTAGKGDQSNHLYDQKQIDLRELESQLRAVNAQIGSMAGFITQAPDGVKVSPDGLHHKQVGLGDGNTYGPQFVHAVNKYNTYKDAMDKLQDKIDAIETQFKDFKAKDGTPFQDLHDNGAVEGVNTGEQYTQTEITYTADSKALVDLQAKLRTANEGIAKMEQGMDAIKKQSLFMDATHVGFVPIIGANHPPTGDQTGAVFSQDDADYKDNLKKLTEAFRDGNPWWPHRNTRTSPAAYAALYQDWVDALGRKTEATNHGVQGDGTTNTFESEKWKVYKSFFKATLDKWRVPGSAEQLDIDGALKVIEDYITDHKTLKPDAGYPTDAESASDANSVNGNGDKSGFTYMNLQEAYNLYAKAYVTKYQNVYGSGQPPKTLAQQAADVKTNYQNLLKGQAYGRAQYQIDLDAANKVINDYKNGHDPLEKGHDQLVADAKAAKELMKGSTLLNDGGLEYKWYAEKIKLDGKRNLFDKSVTDDEIIALSKMDWNVGNTAGKFTPEQADQLAELKGIDAVISQDEKDVQVALNAWKAVRDRETAKGQDPKTNMYLRYTKTDVDKILPWELNKAPIGIGDGNTYSDNAVNAQTHLGRMKAVIATKCKTQDQRDAELKKIMDMSDNSQLGPNTGAPVFLGDKSGNNYEQWELDLYKTEFKQYQSWVSKFYNGEKIAPPGAVPDWNGPGRGDGTGNTYNKPEDIEFIEHFIPEFKPLVAAKEAMQAKLAKDRARKTFLEGLGLDPNQNLDPDQIYRTKAGDQWTIDQFNQAKEFVKEKAIADPLKKQFDDGTQAITDTEQAVKDYEAKYKAAYDKAVLDAKMASTWVAVLSPANIGGTFKLVGTTQTSFDTAKAGIYQWWEDHKGQAVGPAGSKYEFTKISMDYDEFVGGNMDPKSGSLKGIIGMMNSLKSHQNGKINVAPIKPHSQTDLDLRDALEKVAKFPADYDAVTVTSQDASEAFNTLFMMYKNAIDKNHWTAPAGYVSPSIIQKSRKVQLKTSGTATTRFDLYRDIRFDGDAASRAATMRDFNNWLKTFFNSATSAKNAPVKGDGTNKKYNDQFFGGKGQPIKTEADVLASDLGKEAKSVADLFGKVSPMPSNAVVGTNWAKSGDESGLTYTQADLDYYQALKDRAKQMKDIKDLQDKIKGYQPPIGEVLLMTPKGWIGTASATHADPVGDGSGKDHSHELITAVKNYFAYKAQIADQQALIDQLKADYAAQPKETPYHPWEDVIKPEFSGIEIGDNHGVQWSQQEIDYRGADASQSDIQDKIDAITNGPKIPDPKKAGPHGEASKEMVPVTAAPAGVKAGWNSAPTGTNTDESYNQAQLDKRDNLKELNTELTQVQALISTLTAKLKAAGVTQAPSVDTPVAPAAEWHKVPVGDGTGYNYVQKIFDDMAVAKKLQEVLDKAIKTKNDFVANNGQNALDMIDQELRAGMEDGFNFAARYSDAEIALRDNKVKLGTTLDHLHLVGSGDQFKVSQVLTGDSIVGKNIKQVGIGDDNTYDQKELDLRTLDTKIAEIEQQHGLVETDIAHVDKIVYDSTDSKEDAAKGKDTATTQTVEEFYENIDLDSAVVGSNHAPRGDQTGSYYDTASAQAFKDVVALQAQLKADNARIAVLKANWKAAPLGAVAITTAEATLKANDPTLAGKHKVAVGDATGNVYKPKDKVNVVTAAEYVKNLEAYNKAKADLETFTKLHPNEVKFFEYKTLGGQTWNPVAGRNWTDASFDFKAQDDAREKLKIGKTMVNLDEAGTSSEFGINRGQLQSMTNKDTTLVMYQGDASHIADEVLGSDRVRIGYVLNPQGTSHISADAPVLSSLEAVADYLQQHPSLAPDSLIKKFALLQGIKSSSIDEDIEEVTMTKDRFKTIEDNYGIAGDK